MLASVIRGAHYVGDPRIEFLPPGRVFADDLAKAGPYAKT
jgi:hypothetical protein